MTQTPHLTSTLTLHATMPMGADDRVIELGEITLPVTATAADGTVRLSLDMDAFARDLVATLRGFADDIEAGGATEDLAGRVAATYKPTEGPDA